MKTSAGLARLWTTIRIFVVLTVLLGVVFPLVIFGVGRLMPAKADGSLIHDSQGKVVGSALIAQQVSYPTLFYPRPSAADFDAMASGASNTSPYDKDLNAEIATLRESIAAREHVAAEQIPNDAVTTSGSGLDPHISRAYADLQAARVAKANKIPTADMERLLQEHTHKTFNGSQDGSPVNVVTLNLAVKEASRS